MGSQNWRMGMCFWVCLIGFLSFIHCVSSEGEGIGGGSVEALIRIDGKEAIAKVDEDFICATLDWWPPEKCDYGTCSWGKTSLLNLDLSNTILSNAIKAFSPLKLRLGGTLQDQIIYDTEDNKKPCPPIPFVENNTTLFGEMFGFNEACLPMKRWDELNSFFLRTGAKIVFGLNVLTGKTFKNNIPAIGDWDFTNAESFIRYTVKNNYSVAGWELGNELCGKGVGTSISASQYANDSASLRNIVQEIYKGGAGPKPLILAPGGFFDGPWFKEVADKSTTTLDALTHHVYNLGPGVDNNLIEKILDPESLDSMVDTYSKLQNILKTSATSATAWVGESGGAWNSGHHLVTDAFVFSFWYLDQLGMSAVYDTKTYCRQTLVGGNYGLLNTTTFVPNPDYYSALLWHRLMGRNVLATRFGGPKKIRAYTHCAKQSKGIVVLLINLHNTTVVQARVAFNSTWSLRHRHKSHKSYRSHMKELNGLRSRAERVRGDREREEYHLTPKDGNIQSQTMLLNGNALNLDSSGNIPTLEPVFVNSSQPIIVAPFSIVFVHIPYVVPPACR
uniref:heparanase-like protein 3 n=1 Tax=Fragaria vesca subsp. vesca TaxID=101020 RepID=UPI0005CB0F45|nr:PREDICTED: heparanase-like protein 3 [Fragaria vesca subsp. vesca]